MLYSKLFGRTVRDVSQDVTTTGHRLLYQGGYLRDSGAGRFYTLPLGMRVQDKICAIIADEMDRIGGLKMLAPTLHPIDLWRETSRTESVSFELLKVTDRRGADFVLGGTAEEMFVDLVRRFALSYRDLPFMLYQFSTKFRDELRARGGMLRAREFMMKDAYSFHSDAEGFGSFYHEVASAYHRIFDRLGLKAVMVEADNGYMGGEYCHEFVVEHECGESTFYRLADGTKIFHEDLLSRFVAAGGDHRQSTADQNTLSECRGIEVGNIFQLGYYYSERMRGAHFVNRDGKTSNLYMGCYGLGVSRTLATLAEVYHDERGLCWPRTVAPYQVHLVALGYTDQVRQSAGQLYESLRNNNIEVLYDDRSVSAGIKLHDADLLGMPIRIVVSAKTLAAGKVELKERSTDMHHDLRVDEVSNFFREK